MRKILIRFLQWLLRREFSLEYRVGDRVAIEKWLYECYGSKGAMDYFKVEELKILKELARGLTQENYWKQLGKREQLALTLNDIQKVFELRKAAQAKAEAEEKRKGGGKNEKQEAS